MALRQWISPIRDSRYAALSHGPPISHVGAQVLPSLIRGRHRAHVESFAQTRCSAIERERINFTLSYDHDLVMLDTRLDKRPVCLTFLYGASAMSPNRLVEGIERIGPVFRALRQTGAIRSRCCASGS